MVSDSQMLKLEPEQSSSLIVKLTHEWRVCLCIKYIFFSQAPTSQLIINSIFIDTAFCLRGEQEEREKKKEGETRKVKKKQPTKALNLCFPNYAYEL